MRFGCCGALVSSQLDGTGIDVVEQLKKIGYDYIELPLSNMMMLSDRKFEELEKRLYDSGIKCEACNNFFPSNIRLTGEEVDIDKTMDYVEMSLERASKLGVQVVVFGSAKSRNLINEFPLNKVWDQIVALLRDIDSAAKKHEITITIKPLNRTESNIINTVEEGLRLVRDVNRDSIKLVVDYYHFTVEKENPQIILSANDYIKHIHFAEVLERSFPKNIDNNYIIFFNNLKKIGYESRISLEAYSDDFYSEATKSLHLLKKIVNK